MMTYDNWGHVYGIIFNKINYDTFINALISSQAKKDVFPMGNKENEILFISSFIEETDGYAFLIGRTNEEVSKTKFDTTTFISEDIKFKPSEHISDYTHIYISKKSISKTKNSYYLLLEKNQRLQIGSLKTLIGHIIGYHSMNDSIKSKVYIGSMMQSDYINKLLTHEVIGKQIIINQSSKTLIDLPDSKNEETETMVTQISKYKISSHFLNALNYLINNPKSHQQKDIFLVIDDGKTANRKISFNSEFTKYVPFFELPFYIKSTNKNIRADVVSSLTNIVNTGNYETI